jgi:Ca2+:H+ antiporter
MQSAPRLPAWTIAAPLVGWILLAVFLLKPGDWYALLAATGLCGAVLAAVHHAEVVAHRVGEPYGTLVLAAAVTVIELALIVSLMLSGGEAAASLARDTVFATVMIILNGIVGACVLVGSSRHGEPEYSLRGANAALATLAAIVTLTLVLPNYTTTTPGPVYSAGQLIFAAVVSLLLYGTFVFVQTVRHRDYFLPPGSAQPADQHAPPPSGRRTLASLGLLFLCLGAVVLLAKAISPALESALDRAGAPKVLVGVVIAAVVLLPEAIAALRAARANRLQTSLNLALGSALATIGLTIPAVSVVAVANGWTLQLGIDARSTVLLLLSFLVATLSLATGRSTVLHGAIHLVIFAVYLFMTVVP